MAAQTWRDVYPPHPAAELFPMLDDAQLDELAADIKAHGLLHPIVVIADSKRLLDGRNRAEAAERAGFKITPRDVRRAGEMVDPFDYVLSANIRRRHLSTEDRLRLVDEVLKAKPTRSDRQVAKQTGTSPTTVGKRRAKGEQSGDVSTVDTSVDTKGRQQPRNRKTNTKVEEAEPELAKTAAVAVKLKEKPPGEEDDVSLQTMDAFAEATLELRRVIDYVIRRMLADHGEVLVGHPHFRERQTEILNSKKALEELNRQMVAMAHDAENRRIAEQRKTAAAEKKTAS